jgi:hypothetical protein
MADCVISSVGLLQPSATVCNLQICRRKLEITFGQRGPSSCASKPQLMLNRNLQRGKRWEGKQRERSSFGENCSAFHVSEERGGWAQLQAAALSLNARLGANKDLRNGKCGESSMFPRASNGVTDTLRLSLLRLHFFLPLWAVPCSDVTRAPILIQTNDRSAHRFIYNIKDTKQCVIVWLFKTQW